MDEWIRSVTLNLKVGGSNLRLSGIFAISNSMYFIKLLFVLFSLMFVKRSFASVSYITCKKRSYSFQSCSFFCFDADVLKWRSISDFCGSVFVSY